MTTPNRAMVYGRSQLDFPNWWEALDGDGGDPSAGTASDSESTEEAGDQGGAQSEGRSVPERIGLALGASEAVPISKSVPESVPDALREPTTGLAWGRGAYSREVIECVWELAEAVSGNDSELWRKDEFGNWIHRFDYGRRDSRFGWEVFDPGIGRHHQGVYAMRPMQWESYLAYCEVLA